jgi:hypothetical protein
MLIASCSGGDDDTASTSDPTETTDGGVVGTDLPVTTQDPDGEGDTDPADTVPLPELLDVSGDCDPEVAELPADWPFVVPDGVVVTATSVDRLSYELLGVTTDGEVALVDALDTTFAGYEAAESEAPSGPDVLALDFVSDGARGSIEMVDTNSDGCWAVRLVNVLDVAPSTSDPVDAASPDDPLDALSSLGSGEVTTGRGSATLFVTVCGLAPVAVEASGSTGRLELSGSGDEIEARWVHADGVEVVDERARVLALTESSIAVAFSGETPDGQESVIVDLQCTESE